MRVVLALVLVARLLVTAVHTGGDAACGAGDCQADPGQAGAAAANLVLRSGSAGATADASFHDCATCPICQLAAADGVLPLYWLGEAAAITERAGDRHLSTCAPKFRRVVEHAGAPRGPPAQA